MVNFALLDEFELIKLRKTENKRVITNSERVQKKNFNAAHNAERDRFKAFQYLLKISTLLIKKSFRFNAGIHSTFVTVRQ